MFFQKRSGKRRLSVFCPGDLVRIVPDSFLPRQQRQQYLYLLVRQVRWMKPLGELERQWVYDGSVFLTTNGELIYSRHGLDIRENRLEKIPGFVYTRPKSWWGRFFSFFS
jgi:hypothetical protein